MCVVDTYVSYVAWRGCVGAFVFVPVLGIYHYTLSLASNDWRSFRRTSRSNISVEIWHALKQISSSRQPTYFWSGH
jgi:hypothetical protein